MGAAQNHSQLITLQAMLTGAVLAPHSMTSPSTVLVMFTTGVNIMKAGRLVVKVASVLKLCRKGFQSRLLCLCNDLIFYAKQITLITPQLIDVHVCPCIHTPSRLFPHPPHAHLHRSST